MAMKRARPDDDAEDPAGPPPLRAGLAAEHVHPSALRVTPIEGKGDGVVAAAALAPGELLVRARGLRFSEAAAAEGQGSAFLAESLDQLCELRRGSPADAEAMLRGWRGLCPHPVPPEARAPLEAQADALGEMLEHFEGCGVADVTELIALIVKVQCNAFEGGLFPLAAKFNHSCAANCSVALREMELPGEGEGAGRTGWVYEVRTMTAVEPGQELCLCYLGLAEQHLAGFSRRAKLAGWGFDCTCCRCAPTTPEWRQRDAESVSIRCDSCDGWCRQEADDRVGACAACGSVQPPSLGRDIAAHAATLMRRAPLEDAAALSASDVWGLKEAVEGVRAVTHPAHFLRFVESEAIAARTKEVALALRGSEGDKAAFREAVSAHLQACRASVSWAEQARCYAPYERGTARLLEELVLALRAADGAGVPAAEAGGDGSQGAEGLEAEAARLEVRALECMRVAYGGHDHYCV